MFSKSSLSAGRAAEKHLLRQRQVVQWRCARCIHSSRGLREEKKQGNDQGTPYNAPKTGRPRQQRAALMSEEVKLLSRDTSTPPGPSTPPNNAPKDPVPYQSTPSGAMGENESPEREGIATQVNLSRDASGRQGSGMSAADEVVDDEEPINPEEEDHRPADVITKPRSSIKSASVSKRSPQASITGNRYNPSPFTKEDLLHGRKINTIAASNFVGALVDRINTVAEPGRHASNSKDILAKLGANSEGITSRRRTTPHRLHHFATREEFEAAQKAQEQACKDAQAVKSEGGGTPALTPAQLQNIKNTRITSLSAPVKARLLNKFVFGTETDEYQMKAYQNSNPAIGKAKAALANNPTYAGRDGRKFLYKLSTLLPKAQAPVATANKA